MNRAVAIGVGAVALAAVAVASVLIARACSPVALPSGTSGSATTTAAPSAAATSTASTPPTSTTPPREIVIGWVGDTTPGSKYGDPPQDGRALFAYTRRYLKAPDLMVANLEGTFGSGGPSKCDGKSSTACFAFQAPPENAAALDWAGIDVVNLANNHSHDYLAAGMKSTEKALRDNDIAYTGLVDTEAVESVDGVRVGLLGFSPYAWSPSIGNTKKAKALVRDLQRRVDVVIVLMHAGAEGADKTHTPHGGESAYGEFRGDPRAFSHAVVDAGADLVLGSGPHVVRGMERYRGRLIAYSLGNFAGWKNFGRTGTLALSGLLTVRIAGDGSVRSGKWLSLRLTGPGVPAVDPSNASLKLVRTLSRQDFATPVKLKSDGTFTFPAQ